MTMRIAALASTASLLAVAACDGGRAAGPTAAAVVGIDATSSVLTPADAEVVMRGLDNPRGLTFGPDGALYVAEAGRGTTDRACFDVPTPEDCACAARAMIVCYGPTGAVSRLFRGRQERIVTGLPSYANANGRAVGPHDIAMLGVGSAHVTIGLEESPAFRDAASASFPEFASFGTLVRVTPGGAWRQVADLAAYEQAVNPDPRIFDSNPYGLLAVAGQTFVADAGGNSLLAVRANGEVSTLAVMPVVPQTATGTGDAVPTSIVVGPDGAYYVGVLTGAPWRDGFASVYRLEPGGTPQPYRTGFKGILDIAFDAAGRLLVLQHSSGLTGIGNPGLLVRVSADGSARETLLEGLVRPTSVAIGADGAIYVTNRGLTPGAGEVLRIAP